MFGYMMDIPQSALKWCELKFHTKMECLVDCNSTAPELLFCFKPLVSSTGVPCSFFLSLNENELAPVRKISRWIDLVGLI